MKLITGRSFVFERTRRFSSLAVMGLLLASIGFLADARPAAAKPLEALRMPIVERSLLVGGAAIGEKMWLVGERGHVLLSTDGGTSWKQARSVPTRATLTAVYFNDEKLGWAVGHDAVILRTVDGGESWSLVFSAPELDQPLLDVRFLDENNGFAIGAYGYFLVTSDGGVSWAERRISEDDWHLNKFARAQSGKMYIAAEAGYLYRSDDGGENWIVLPTPYEGSFHSVLPLKGDSLVVLGMRGHLFLSRDAGQNWEELETGVEALLTDAKVAADGRLVLVGTAGMVLVGLPDGKGLNLRQLPDRRSIAGVLVHGENLTIFGEGGVTSLPLTDAGAVASGTAQN